MATQKRLTWPVICVAVFVTAIMIYKAAARLAFDTKLQVLHIPASNRSEIIQKIKNGDYDIAPFNRSHLIPPFLNFRPMIEIAQEYGLYACVIEKVMSVAIDAIFCYLTNTTEFTANNRTISTEKVGERFCGRHNKHLGYELDGNSTIPRVQFVTIRHPMQRFLSGYADKCSRRGEDMKSFEVCFKCGDLQCFIERLYTYLKMLYLKRVATSLPPFQSPIYDSAAVHFAPQNWYCNFYKHFDDYIILRQGENREEITAYAKKFRRILKEANVPEFLRKEIHRQLLIERRTLLTELSFSVCESDEQCSKSAKFGT